MMIGDSLKLVCFIRGGMLQQFSFDEKLELHKYCLAHLFTYQKFVDPPDSNAHIYGLAWIGSPKENSGICAGCHVVLLPLFVPEYVTVWSMCL